MSAAPVPPLATAPHDPISVDTVGNAAHAGDHGDRRLFAGNYATQKAAAETGCPAGILDNDNQLNNSLGPVNLFPPGTATCKVGSYELAWDGGEELDGERRLRLRRQPVAVREHERRLLGQRERVSSPGTLATSGNISDLRPRRVARLERCTASWNPNTRRADPCRRRMLGNSDGCVRSSRASLSTAVTRFCSSARTRRAASPRAARPRRHGAPSSRNTLEHERQHGVMLRSTRCPPARDGKPPSRDAAAGRRRRTGTAELPVGHGAVERRREPRDLAGSRSSGVLDEHGDDSLVQRVPVLLGGGRGRTSRSGSCGGRCRSRSAQAGSWQRQPRPAIVTSLTVPLGCASARPSRGR